MIARHSIPVNPTIEAIQAIELNSVTLLGTHSRTIYRIMGSEDTHRISDTADGTSVDLEIDTTMSDSFAPVTLLH